MKKESKIFVIKSTDEAESVIATINTEYLDKEWIVEGMQSTEHMVLLVLTKFTPMAGASLSPLSA